jgi:hypothetical protein
MGGGWGRMLTNTPVDGYAGAKTYYCGFGIDVSFCVIAARNASSLIGCVFFALSPKS